MQLFTIMELGAVLGVAILDLGVDGWGGWVSGHLGNQGGLQELDTQFWLSSMFWRSVCLFFFLFFCCFCFAFCVSADMWQPWHYLCCV